MGAFKNNKAKRTYARPKTILKHALDWLADKDHWTIGTRFETATGRTCALGAVERFAATPSAQHEAEVLLSEIAHDLHGVGVVELNDGAGKRTKLRWKKVLGVFEKALGSSYGRA